VFVVLPSCARATGGRGGSTRGTPRSGGWDVRDFIPSQTVVFFDDPSVDDFTRLYPYDEKFDRPRSVVRDTLTKTTVAGFYRERKVDTPVSRAANRKHGSTWEVAHTEELDVPVVEQTEIGGRKYFIKPDDYRLGHGLDYCHVFFTTTELLIKEMACEQYGLKEDNAPSSLVADRAIDAGDVFVLPTGLVREKLDGLLPCMIERIKRTYDDVEYIADGQGSSYNTINNKGVNTLQTKNVVIEISQPHLSRVTWMCDEVGWDPMADQQAMRLCWPLTAAQAIGRNSGYRYSDNAGLSGVCCVV
jgi:hypothetical protein